MFVFGPGERKKFKFQIQIPDSALGLIESQLIISLYNTPITIHETLELRVEEPNIVNPNAVEEETTHLKC
jgi:hypothetical protein